MSNEIVLITGANTGIGFETVRALFSSSKPYHVLFGSRDLGKADVAIAKLKEEFPSSQSTVEPIQIDVIDDDSIQKAYELVSSKFDKIDVLLNNADAPNFRELFNKAYDVNTTGAQVMTTVFAPFLIKSSNPRLLFITSGISTLEGSSKGLFPQAAVNPPAGWPKKDLLTAVAYRSSKTALNMVMLVWHHLLKADGVKTWAVSPGFVLTGLGGMTDEVKKARGVGDPAVSGHFLKNIIEGERDADVGKVVHVSGSVQPW